MAGVSSALGQPRPRRCSPRRMGCRWSGWAGSRDNRQFDQRNDQRIDQQTGLQVELQFGQADFERGYDRGRVIVETNNYFDKGGRYNDRTFMESRKDMKISMINREYDFKIQKVRRSFYMTWFEKQRQIRFLENQRRWEINMVYAKFDKYRFDDRRNRDDCNDNRYDRNDNRYDRNDNRHDHNGNSNDHY